MGVVTWLRSVAGPGPAKPQWLDGFISAFVYIVPILVGVIVNIGANFLTAAAIAMMTVNMLPRDTWLTRRLVSGVVAVIVTACAAFVGVMAAPHLWSAALAFGAFCFLGGMLVSLGSAGQTAAVLVPISMTMMLPLTTAGTRGAIEVVLGVLIGGAWALVATYVIAKVRRQHFVLDRFAALFRNLAATATLISRQASDAELTPARNAMSVAVSDAIAATSGAMFSRGVTARQVERGRGLVAQGMRLGSALMDVEHRLAEFESVPEPAGSALAAVASWCDDTASGLETIADLPEVPTPQAILDAIDALDDDPAMVPLAKALIEVREAVSHTPGQVPDVWRDHSPDELLRANLTWRSQVFRNAARFGVAAFVAGALAFLLGAEHGWWIGLTVSVVLKASIGATLDTITKRVLGTLVGVIIGGTIASLLFGLPDVMILVSTIFVVLMVALRPLNYLYWAMTISPFVILSTSAAATTTSSWTLAGFRAVDTLIGGLIAFGATMLLWPNKGAKGVPNLVATELRALADYVRGAVDNLRGPEKETLRAKTALSNQNGRLAIEGWREELRVDNAAIDSYERTLDMCVLLRDRISVVYAERALGAQPSQANLDALTGIEKELQTLALQL